MYVTQGKGGTRSCSGEGGSRQKRERVGPDTGGGRGRREERRKRRKGKAEEGREKQRKGEGEEERTQET